MVVSAVPAAIHRIESGITKPNSDSFSISWFGYILNVKRGEDRRNLEQPREEKYKTKKNDNRLVCLLACRIISISINQSKL
ncbi:hypothetical protein I7I48_05616 [Histoplasma ohiense]|nr:hypothetical protein I7I48_05616 [Histoplasma ohiense (nom. inval.)]